MPRFTSLPCEVVAAILQKLDNVRDLLPTLLSCRHIYSSFKESPSILFDIFRNQIAPALLPYSVAVMEASRSPTPRTAASIKELLDVLYNEPTRLSDRLQTLPLSLIVRMGRTHDVIQDFANDFATDAWTLLSQSNSGISDSMSPLSTTEHLRFYRAFYRVELFIILFRGGETGTLEACQNECFFEKHLPWEIEQLGCIHDFLEKRLSHATFDILAHDVGFGEFRVDYLTLGGDNYPKQRWLSQGLAFIHDVVKEDIYDRKKVMLESTYTSSQVPICEALNNAVGDARFRDYTEDNLEALVQRHDVQDTDLGPLTAWRAVHGAGAYDAIMMADSAGHRERAYVLWDLDRIYRHNMLQVFEKTPENSSHTYAYGSDVFAEMEESFEERSKIWQKGGSGYWSKGDDSRVLWPGKSTQSTD